MITRLTTDQILRGLWTTAAHEHETRTGHGGGRLSDRCLDCQALEGINQELQQRQREAKAVAFVSTRTRTEEQFGGVLPNRGEEEA